MSLTQGLCRFWDAEHIIINATAKVDLIGYFEGVSLGLISTISGLGFAALGPPLGSAKPSQGLEFAITEFDVSGADHTGFEAHGVSHVVVYCGRGIVAHDKIVAVSVLHLMDRDGTR